MTSVQDDKKLFSPCRLLDQMNSSQDSGWSFQQASGPGWGWAGGMSSTHDSSILEDWFPKSCLFSTYYYKISTIICNYWNPGQCCGGRPCGNGSISRFGLAPTDLFRGRFCNPSGNECRKVCGFPLLLSPKHQACQYHYTPSVKSKCLWDRGLGWEQQPGRHLHACMRLKLHSNWRTNQHISGAVMRMRELVGSRKKMGKVNEDMAAELTTTQHSQDDAQTLCHWQGGGSKVGGGSVCVCVWWKNGVICSTLSLCDLADTHAG